MIILYRYPAGLLVYWITTNLWTIGQQLVIRRYMGTPPSPATRKGAADRTSPNGKPPAGVEPALAPAAVAGAEPQSAPPRSAPPPRSPRKKKKRSGRRR